ncbi:MAG: citramalate synthase [Promethearchaeota archaeon]
MIKNKSVYIYDTTLREGSQKTGISFSVEDKIHIIERLIRDLHIPMIEVGWPGSNPKDISFYKKIQSLEINSDQTKIYAFGSTRRKNITTDDDRSLKSILNVGTKNATIFGKSWDLHVNVALETSLKENLSMIEDSIFFLKKNGIDVVYDAEHFFDGFKNNKEYALQTIAAAFDAGASWVVLCDTNGGLLPHELGPIFNNIMDFLGKDINLGIHAHNDSGLANAIALEAVNYGVKMVQGTINGFGERCGNTDLTTILPILKLKMGIDCIDIKDLYNITDVSHFVYEIANLQRNSVQPFVGKNAFSHKGGVHISAIQKDPKTYEHINPEMVGNSRNIKISELAGKSTITHMAKRFGMHFAETNPKIAEILKVVKEKEKEGYVYEGAEGSLEIIIRSMDMNIQDPDYYRKKFFEFEGFRVITELHGKKLISEATIKVRVEGQEFHTAAEGNGPVNALDNALKKALVYFYPSIKEINLSDFKVRIINKAGTASKVRVLVETTDNGNSWGTIGTHENIILASWNALVDSYIFKLLKNENNW